MKRATLKDIAKLTGLSISGVSRALKDHPDIGRETKERVKEVALALKYSPNLNARSLRTLSSRIIAVILPKLTDFFFPKLLKGISEIVEARGYSLIFLQSNNNLKREEELVDFCLNVFAEGVLISLSVETDKLDHLQKLKEADIPTVLIDRVIKNDDFPSVTIDDREISFTAVEYLIEQGHNNILGIFGDSRLKMTALRVEGYRLAHAHHQIAIKEEQILMVPSEYNLEEEITAYIKGQSAATAIFTMSDTLLVHTYQAIKQLGLSIPDDVSLISISDGIAPNYLFPKITHLRHSGHEVGSKATNLLFNIIDGMSPAFSFYKIDAALVKLGS
ncbi:MAG: LacI family transcriptional regulator [Saprospiraceae bacterium]|jgi:LacI family transcriptional regulator